MEKIKNSELKEALSACVTKTDIPIWIGNRGFDVEMKFFLSPAEQVAFVRNVIAGCTVDGEIAYSLFDYVFKATVVSFFTNFKLPSATSDVCVLLSRTGIIEKLYNSEASTSLYALLEACEKEIDYAQQRSLAFITAAAKPDPMDRIADAVENFLANESELFSKVDSKALIDMVTKVSESRGNIVDFVAKEE